MRRKSFNVWQGFSFSVSDHEDEFYGFSPESFINRDEDDRNEVTARGTNVDVSVLRRRTLPREVD